MTHDSDKETTAATRPKARRRRKPPIIPRVGQNATILTGGDDFLERPKRPPEDILFGPDPTPPPAKTGDAFARTATAPRTAADILFGGSDKDASPTKIAQAASAPSPAPSRLPQSKPPGAGAQGNPVLPKVPAYKAGVFVNPAKNPPGTFRRFTGAVGKLAGATATETRIYQEIFAAEGGVDVAPNGASSGITRTTLNDTIDRGRFGAVPRGTWPDQLTIDQRAAFYRAYFDDVLGTAAAALSTGRNPQGPTLKGHDLLNEISNPFAAAAIADALFHHGRGAGTRVIQQAIEDVRPGSLKNVDGRMGPNTFEALQDIVANPTLVPELLNALTDQRRQLLRRVAAQQGQSVARGDLARVEHFRFGAVR